MDEEQIVLEFVAPEKVMSDLFSHEKSAERPTVSREIMDKIIGWKTEPSDAVKEALDAAPKWFVPANPTLRQVIYVGTSSAVVEFPGDQNRYQLTIYDNGRGHIYVDRLASRAYIAQENGKLF